jgi:uncharacterized protein (TIGR02118 family)
MTIKRITLLKRKREMTPADFRAHWAGPHAAIARNLPGLVRYNQNHVLAASVTGPDGEWPVHGFVELWFRDRASVVEAAGSSVTRDLVIDEPNFLDGLTGLDVDASPSHGASAQKVFVIGKPVADSAGPHTSGADLLLGISRLEGFIDGHADHAIGDIMRRDHLWSEPEPPQFIIWTTFSSPDTARLAFDHCQIPAAGSHRPEVYLTEEIRIV